MAPLKILMLHGYTRSGSLFHAKTKALEKHLQKAFPGTHLSYPTGPMRLNPADIPGFDASEGTDPSDIEAYAWWRRSNTAEPPEYVGIEDGLATVATVLSSEGPFDGVIGFSQGAALAAMVTSLLEGRDRREAFKHFQSLSSLAIPHPKSFAAIEHPPLKFYISYSGFIAPGERYQAFYDHPRIQVPSCHFLGSVDSVVEEARSKLLVEACGGEERARVIWHPGGHFMPTSKQYLDILVEFIKRVVSPENKDKKVEEENVEDMEVPF